MSNLVQVKLHGDLGLHLCPEWELAVSSVREAISAINTLTKNSFSNYFINNDKLRAKYRVLINGRDFLSPEPEINEHNSHLVTESELYMEKKDIKTIDIVPVLEAADSKTGGIFGIIIGAILIVVGAVTGQVYLAIAGLALIAGGATALLTRPPKSSFGRTAPDGKSQSYLFNGPTNTIGEGGPVPIGYGSLLVGSQVISSAFKIEDYTVQRAT